MKGNEKPNWYLNKVSRNIEYNKNNTTRIVLSLNNKTDSDVIECLNSKQNKQGYIKSLIRNDISKTK